MQNTEMDVDAGMIETPESSNSPTPSADDNDMSIMNQEEAGHEMMDENVLLSETELDDFINEHQSDTLEIYESGENVHTTEESTTESPALVQAAKKKKIVKVVIESTNLDLETWAQNYSGHTRVDRLLFIANRCPPLRQDAFRLAIDDLKQSKDVKKYEQTVKTANDLGVRIPLDTAWIEQTTKEARFMMDKLENELRSYKSSMIKESIRMGHNDLAKHYYECGNLTEALKSYSRTRDFCSTPKHIIDMCLDVIRVSVELGNYTHVSSFVAKAESVSETLSKVVSSKLNCASGLLNLDGGRFKHAAEKFLSVAFEMGSSFNDVISPNDVAIYGGLCAIASFERAELKSKILENTEFKQYLELEPQIREIVYGFYHSKYSNCLTALQGLKNDFLLDIHLHPHVDHLFAAIRKRAIVTYFTPFANVDLKKMCQVFGSNVDDFEKEIVGLILDGSIKGRVDSHNKVLYANQTNLRTQIYTNTRAMGEDYVREVKHSLLRMKLIKNGLLVKEARSRNVQEEGTGSNPTRSPIRQAAASTS